MAKRFNRKTKGFNAQVFVSKAINITDDATYALFLQNAPLGEIGVFDANGAAHTDAITAAEEFFFAQRTTLGVKKTPQYKLADLNPGATKQLYIAPVKQVSSIGWSGTGGSLINPTLVAGQVYGIKVIETTEGQDPFPTWNYEYTVRTNDVAIDIMRGIAKIINNDNAVEHISNKRLVSAKVKADATYGNYALTGTTPTLTFTNGSNIVTVGGTTPTHDVAVNDLLSIDTAATPTDAIGDIYKVIAVNGIIDITLDRIYTGTTIALTEAQAEGTRLKKVTAVVDVGIELTALNFGENFRLARYGKAENADINYTTAYVNGNGTSDQVTLFETEGQTFHGDTTKNAAFTDKYGKQDNFVVAAETYDMYTFNFLKSNAGMGFNASTSMRSHVVIATAKSGGTNGATLNTLFGL